MQNIDYCMLPFREGRVRGAGGAVEVRAAGGARWRLAVTFLPGPAPLPRPPSRHPIKDSCQYI